MKNFVLGKQPSIQSLFQINMTRKIFYASLLLLLTHHFLFLLFVIVNVEGSSVNKPPLTRLRSQKPSAAATEQNINSGLPQHNQFVLFKLANLMQRSSSNTNNSASINGTLEASMDDSSNSSVTALKNEPINIVSSAPKFLSSVNALKDVAEVPAHEMKESVPRSPLSSETNFNLQMSDAGRTISTFPLPMSMYLKETDEPEMQIKNKERSFLMKNLAMNDIFSENSAEANARQPNLISPENLEKKSGEFVPSTCDAVLELKRNEITRKKTMTPNRLQKSTSLDSNVKDVPHDDGPKAPPEHPPTIKDDQHETSNEVPRWTCLPPEPRSASLSFSTTELCCCSTIDVFWSAYNAEKAELRNHTIMWNDFCTYYNETKTVICSGSQVMEVPTLKAVLEEVNTMIFDNTNIKSLEEQAATEKLPKSHGLGFTNGALCKINPGFLAKIRTNELTLSNNSLSAWNFSWFASESPSNITSINLELNTIKFLPNQKVGPEFVLPHLHTLVLSDNPLLVIPPDLFRPLTYSPVKCLGLRNCCLEDFGQDRENSIESSLEFLPFLEALDLSMNPHLASHKIARFLSPLQGRLLRTLVLSNNGYVSVPYSALETVSSSLMELDLHSSSLSCLDNSSFPYLPQLRSLNLDFCRISSLLPGTFDSIPNLESLSLQGNRFVNVPSAVRLPRLKELNFKGNPRIEDEHEECSFSLENDSFRGMTGLEELNLAETPLQSIHTGQFYGLRSLRTLTLTRCLIRSIQPGAFATLENLHSLYLNANLLEFLDNNSFSGLHNLEFLNLDGNEISLTRPYPSPLSPLLDDGIYSQGKSMDIFSHGQFRPRVTKDHSKSETSFSTSARPFSMLKKLQVLSLASNRIGTLVPVFDHLECLKVLDLSQNVVYDWTKRVFQFTPSLSKLNLRDNQLSSFTDAMIADFTEGNLTEIDIGLNPFICTCNLYDALKELNPEDFVHYDAYTCEVEDSFPEQHIPFTDPHEECNSPDISEDIQSSSMTGIVLLAVVLAGLVTSVVAATFALRRKRMRNRESTEAEENGIQMEISHQYDVFICYAAAEKSWVFKTLLPVFEMNFGLQVCVHERDFEPGDMIVENISSSIAKSRKLKASATIWIEKRIIFIEKIGPNILIRKNITVLFVVSRASVSSHWCRLELDFTRNSNINEGTNKLIMLLKEAVPIGDQPQFLRHLLNTRTYIEWADDPHVQALAWTKLRRALAKRSVAIKSGS